MILLNRCKVIGFSTTKILFYLICVIDDDFEDVHEVIDHSVKQLQKTYGDE